MRATKIGRLTIWQFVEPAVKRSIHPACRIGRSDYLAHFTCAFTAIPCGVADISLETMKWYVPGPGKS